MKTKKLVLLFCLVLAITLIAVNLITLDAQADSSLWDNQEGLGNSNQVGQAFGEDDGTPKDIQEIVALVISVFLQFLGIIFVALIVMAGFNYMTSQGNEEKIEKALSQIKTGVIGLVIIMSAYAITTYMTDCVLDITTKDSTWMCKPPQY